MGISKLYIKLPNGEVKYGSYQDTNDCSFNKVFNTLKEQDEKDDRYRETHDITLLSYTKEDHDRFKDEHENIVEVEVYCNYGKGTTWYSELNTRVDCLVGNKTFLYSEDIYFDHEPEWVELNNVGCVNKIKEGKFEFLKD